MIKAIIGLAALAIAAVPPAASSLRVTTGVVYGTAQVGAPAPGSTRLLLDLYQPAIRSTARRPVVVLIHGGGFMIGTRSDPGLERVARGLAQRGIVVASIDYRLMGSDPVPSARMAPLVAAVPPVAINTASIAAIDDTLTAIGYLRAHAGALHIDPDRLGLIGSSAGAITADHVAYILDDHGIARPSVAFVASLWGGLELPPGGSPAQTARQLEHGEPALFAVHASGDRIVPVALDDALVARARAMHVRTEYDRVAGGQHGFAGTGFFTRTVRNGQTAFGRLLDFAHAALAR